MLHALMIGDVVGDSGLEVLEARLPGLIREQAADLVVVNGENAAGGFGMTGAVLERILAAGADLVSSGNHVWEKRDFWPGWNRIAGFYGPPTIPPERRAGAGCGWKRPGPGVNPFPGWW